MRVWAKVWDYFLPLLKQALKSYTVQLKWAIRLMGDIFLTWNQGVEESKASDINAFLIMGTRMDTLARPAHERLGYVNITFCFCHCYHDHFPFNFSMTIVSSFFFFFSFLFSLPINASVITGKTFFLITCLKVVYLALGLQFWKQTKVQEIFPSLLSSNTAETISQMA